MTNKYVRHNFVISNKNSEESSTGHLVKNIYLTGFHDNAGPRITVPRSLRWAACGAVTVSSSTALLVRLFSPECEPQNIAAYDKKK